MALDGEPTRDESDVTVTLKARNPGPQFVEPERQFTLTDKHPIVRIGRASKVPTKNCVSGRNNAWFESPVMSREHAELVANFETKASSIPCLPILTLSIKDVNSLHGTFHSSRDDAHGKEERLPARQLVALGDGDRIRFGIDIYRSHETFPPCIVDVDMQWNHPTPQLAPSRAPSTNTFSVPDADDEDDVLSDSDSFSEVDRSLPYHMGEDTPVALPPVRQTIDLTQDAYLPRPRAPRPPFAMPSRMTNGQCAVDSDVIDLTSEPNMDSEEDNDECNSHVRGHSPSEASIHVKLHDDLPSSPVMRVDSSDAEMLGDSEIPQVRGYTTSPSLSPSPSQASILLSEASEVNSLHGDLNADGSEVDSAEDGLSGDSADDNSMCESDMMYQSDDDLDEEDEGNLHTIPYYEDGMSSASDEDEDMEANLFDKQHSPAFDSPSSSSPVAPAAESPAFKPGSPMLTSAAASVHPVAEPPQVNTIQPMTTFFGPPFGLSSQTALPSSALSRDRQPSPSDAAMVKNYPFWGQSQVYTKQSTAEALGEKTGKFEFFAARDQNRTTIMANPLLSAVRPASSAAKPVSTAANEANMANMAKHSPAMSTPLVDEKVRSPILRSHWVEPTPAEDTPVDQSKCQETVPALVESAWTASGEAFLNQPRHFPLPQSEERTRLQSPELDMTSAATFLESKSKPESKASPIPRRLPIQDLLAHESKETSPAPKQVKDTSFVAKATSPRPPKRSFAEVFTEATQSSSVEQPAVASAQSASPHPLRAILQRIKRTDGTMAIQVIHTDIPGAPSINAPKEAKPEATERARVSSSPSPRSEVVSVAPVERDDIRPAKRRRFAQVAACALGTVMGGAAVLAGMIVTAPQL
ncbi:hypothetical protein BJ170DRAFT_679213 [Xylariales sp. AK1849]|nr:hypothetical protein BJ170DRAFT_679213 [Xylariales sp. AK1849]